MYSRSYLSTWPYKEYLQLIDLFKLIFFLPQFLCVYDDPFSKAAQDFLGLVLSGLFLN